MQWVALLVTSDLVGFLEPGGQVVPYPPHGLKGWLVEVGGLTIHHLNHHDPQRPDVHLHTEGQKDRWTDGQHSQSAGLLQIFI